jgi:hypothetical protein
MTGDTILNTGCNSQSLDDVITAFLCVAVIQESSQCIRSELC